MENQCTTSILLQGFSIYPSSAMAVVHFSSYNLAFTAYKLTNYFHWV